MFLNWVPMTHAYSPSNSGSRDQEDHSLKPAKANSSQDPISKKPITKKGCWSGSRCRPQVQTPVLQKNVFDGTWFQGLEFVLGKHSTT
jgi:hypothetical protein